MLNRGWICESKSPYSSRVVLALKDNSWLFCINYAPLNSIIKSDRFPTMLIEDILSSLSGMCVFSKIDLLSSY